MGHPITLKIRDNSISTQVRFEFVDDGGEFAVRSAKEELGWAFQVHNCNSADGRGTAKPVLLGHTDTDLLFLHFRVFLYGKTEDYTVHYTFFAVNKEAVGWQATSG